MMKHQEHPLYIAATAGCVSERTATETWTTVAKFVHNYKGVRSALLAEFKMVEEQIKKDYAIKQLPAAWRSAKSVALKAHNIGVVLMLSETEAKPKTALEKEIRALKAKQTLSLEGEFLRALKNAAAYANAIPTMSKETHGTMLLALADISRIADLKVVR